MTRFALAALSICTLIDVQELNAAERKPETIVKIWPKAAPGESGKIGPEKVLPHRKGQRRVKRITNVTTPTISLYRPPKGKANGCGVVICPGGGYHILAYDLEGTEVAEWLNTIGVTAVVLKYRVPRRDKDAPHKAPLQDVQRAIRLTRQHASDWGIDADRLGVLGFSVGGHLTVMAGTHWDRSTYPKVDEADKLNARPDFLIPIYAAYLADNKDPTKLSPLVRINKKTPPTFLSVAWDDKTRGTDAAMMFIALKRAGVKAEVHIYSHGGHGYGLRPAKVPAPTWFKRCGEWMKAMGFLNRTGKSENVPLIRPGALKTRDDTAHCLPGRSSAVNMPVYSCRVRQASARCWCVSACGFLPNCSVQRTLQSIASADAPLRSTCSTHPTSRRTNRVRNSVALGRASSGTANSKSTGAIQQLRTWLKTPAGKRTPIDKQPFAATALSKTDAATAKKLLWDDYVKNERIARAAEMKSRVLKQGQHEMKFDVRIYGKKRKNGRSLYISMHGGGGTTKRVNDRQWENQKRLYKPKEGVYVAPRAPTNTWNLWHQGHIDPLFDRLIQNMVLFHDVDPNRVYLTGYSAGGDGCYQLAPRMADRWAAAAMMAGHPNDASPLSLRNIAFAIHVGELDRAYKRNEVGKAWGKKLAELRKADPKGYVHYAKIHKGRGHWMNREDAVAIEWMAKHIRNPLPAKIVWRQDDVTHNRFYWLRVDKENRKARSEIRATRKGQTVTVSGKGVDAVTVMFNDAMLNLDESVVVKAGMRERSVQPRRTIAMLAKTLAERGDRNLMFSTEVRVNLTPKAKNVPPLTKGGLGGVNSNDPTRRIRQTARDKVRKTPRRGSTTKPRVATNESAPWVTVPKKHQPQRGCTTEVLSPPPICGTPLGFVHWLPNPTQGGAAAPLTLGCVVQPLRGNRASSNVVGRRNPELRNLRTIALRNARATPPGPPLVRGGSGRVAYAPRALQPRRVPRVAPKPEPKPKAGEKTVQQLAALVRKSVVVVSFTGRDGKTVGVGSGFVISNDGLIATNLHVIGEARPIFVQTADGKKFPVKTIHATESKVDLALIKIDAKNLTPLPLGNSDTLKQGQKIVALGNPQGLQFSVVSGVVSGRRKIDGKPLIQLAIPIERGNSGGPMLDMNGRVHGILTLKSLVTRNLGFAVTINALKPLIAKPNPVPMKRWLTIGTLDSRRWETLFGATWRQRAGRISVSGRGSGFGGRVLALSKQKTPNTPFEVGVRVKLADEAGAAGLAFHADGNTKHYGFYPTNGKLRLSRFEGPDVYSWKVLREVRSPHFRPGEFNAIKVRIEQGRLKCFVNDRLVIESTDTGFTKGRVGLVAFRGTAAEFRRFRVGKKLPRSEPTAEVAKLIKQQVRDIAANRPPAEPLIAKLAPHAGNAETVLRRRAKELEQQAERLRQLASLVHEAKARRELTAVFKQKDEAKIDLLKAALLIAHIDNEEVDVPAHLRQVNRMVADVSARLKKNASETDRLKALDKYLFQEMGFHGSRTNYYNKSNSYMNEVIDDREGLPILLSVLYMEMARRLKLKVVGVGLPGHFVVRFEPKNGKPQLIDPFDRGKRMTRKEAEELVTATAGLKFDEEFLKAQTKRAIVERMLQNLMGLARDKADPEAMLRYIETLVALNPNSGLHRWFRAVLYYNTKRTREALADVEQVLKQQPKEVELRQVKQLKQILERALETSKR